MKETWGIALALLPQIAALYGPPTPGTKLIAILAEPGMEKSAPQTQLFGTDLVVSLQPEVRKTDDPWRRDQRLYQLSHELVHVNFGGGEGDATMIEEGLAVHYSLKGVKYGIPIYAKKCREQLGPRYARALELVTPIVKGPGGTAGLRHMRAERPRLFDWDADFIVAGLGVSPEIAQEMIQRNEMRPRA